VALAGAVSVACGYALMAVAHSFAVASAAAVFMGLGLALLYPSMGVFVSTGVPPEQRGAGFGAYLVSLDVAFGLGPAIGGLIVSASSTEVAFFSGTAMALCAVPLLAVRRTPTPAD
jgi:MFS family permease